MSETITKRNGYSLEADLLPIIEGKTRLPNFERLDLAETMNSIAAVGHSLLAKWGWAAGVGDFGSKQWAMYLLSPAAMGSANHGSFDGSGYVVIYNGRYKEGPIVGRFAICKHEKKASADANPSRGWHPGHCVKCGLDMTIDSGD